MAKWIKKYYPFLVILALTLMLVDSCRHKRIETVYVTDTVTVTKVDTLELVSPIFVTKKVVDTFFVYLKDSTTVSLPVEQKYYKQNGKYEAWISGINPNLDKINVFNKTEYKTTTNTTTHTIYKNTWKGYISGEILTFDSKVIPSIDLIVISPKSLLFGAGIGIYDNALVYNFNIGWKIFGK